MRELLWSLKELWEREEKYKNVFETNLAEWKIFFLAINNIPRTGMTTSAHNYVKKNFNALELTGFSLSLLRLILWHVDVVMAFVSILASTKIFFSFFKRLYWKDVKKNLINCVLRKKCFFSNTRLMNCGSRRHVPHGGCCCCCNEVSEQKKSSTNI
jgi:hypothetical protein